MNVSSIAAAHAATTPLQTQAAPPAPSLNYNDFLTLLLAEMKNQDPTKPMDASAMVSQLASISAVGQAVQTNTTLSSMLTAASITQAEQLVGKTITSSDGLTSGVVTSVTVSSSGAVATLANGGLVTLSGGVTIEGP